MLSFQCYGKHFTLDGPAAAEPLLRQAGFEPSQEATTDEPLLSFRLEAKGAHYNLHLGEALLSREQSLPLLLELIASRVHLAVSGAVSEVTFLRGDVVREEEGATVFAGGDFTGQTRLAMALINQGGKPWSSHFAVVNQKGELLPYPCPALPSTGAAPRVIALVNFQPGKGTELAPASPGVTSMHLITLVRGDKEAVPRAMPRLALCCQSAQVRVTGRRGETVPVLAQLRSLAAANPVV